MTKLQTAAINRPSRRTRLYFMWLWLKLGERLMDPDVVDQKAMSGNIEAALRLKNQVRIRFVEEDDHQRVADCNRILRRMYDWLQEIK